MVKLESTAILAFNAWIKEILYKNGQAWLSLEYCNFPDKRISSTGIINPGRLPIEHQSFSLYPCWLRACVESVLRVMPLTSLVTEAFGVVTISLVALLILLGFMCIAHGVSTDPEVQALASNTLHVLKRSIKAGPRHTTPAREEIEALLTGRKLTTIVFFLDETFEEIAYDMATTVSDAVELDVLIHPFFDELRDPNARLPNGRFLPPLFEADISEADTRACEKAMSSSWFVKLIEHAKKQLPKGVSKKILVKLIEFFCCCALDYQ